MCSTPKTTQKHPLSLAVVMAFSGAAQAAEYAVTEPLDDGTGLQANTLSWAILQANTNSGADLITLSTDVTTTGVMKRLIDSDVTLTSDATHRSISGNNQYRPLFIKSGVVSLSNITISNGLAEGGEGRNTDAGAGMGGGLFIYDGDVTMSEVTINASSAVGGEVIPGGCNSTGGGMFGYGLFDSNGLYGGYGLYQNNDPNFGSAGGTGQRGGFGGGGGRGAGIGYSYPGAGGFGAGGGTGEIYVGRAASVDGTKRSSCSGDYYYQHVHARGGFGSGDGYGGAGHGAGMGGALFIRSGQVRFEHVTISNNNADALDNAKGLGGGLFVLHTLGGFDMPASLPTVSGCRLIFNNNLAKSVDSNMQTTDDVFDLSERLNAGLDYDSSDACVLVAGNGQTISQNDDTPNSADGTHFGGVEVGSGVPITHSFEFNNTGPVEIQFTNPAVNVIGDHPADFQASLISPTTLAAGASATFEVTFDPTVAGLRQAVIEVTFTDGSPSIHSFSVDGQGLVNEPEIEVQGLGQTILNGSTLVSSVDNTLFPATQALGDFIAQDFTVLNTGNQPLSLTGSPLIEIGGEHANDFFVLTTPPATISAGGEELVTVVFEPTGRGQRNAEVWISSTDPDEPLHQHRIEGLGLGPKGELFIRRFANAYVFVEHDQPPSFENRMDLGGAYINPGNTLTRRFAVRNGGEFDLTLLDNPAVSLTNNEGDRFSIETIAPDTTVSPQELPGHTFDLIFEPATEVGLHQALISISSNDPNNPVLEYVVQARSKTELEVTNTGVVQVVEGQSFVVELLLDETLPVNQDVSYKIWTIGVTQDDLLTPLEGTTTLLAGALNQQFTVETFDDDLVETTSNEAARVEFRIAPEGQLVGVDQFNDDVYFRIVDNDPDDLFKNGFESE